MSPELHQRVRKLFDEALEKPEGERPAFLDATCAGEPEVRQAVNRLLDAHREADRFMASQRGAERRLGRYIIGRELGRGAMGVVYEGIDPLIGRNVAVKVIRMDALAETGKLAVAREQLFREAHSAGRLLHPGIVVIFDVGEEGETAFIAMELVEGRSLLDLLTANRRPPVREVLEILRQAAAALDYAHQNGIVHRDIKPANIMLHKGNAVKIADFGVAKISSLQFRTATGIILGTPTYMSPEQVEMRALDGRSDQFSLAVVAYEMLAGCRPFVADSLATLAHLIVYAERPSARGANAALSEQADAVLRRGLAKQPEERYSTCTEFVTALGDALWEAPRVTAIPVAPAVPPPAGPPQTTVATPSALSPPPVSSAPKSSAAIWVVAGLLLVAALMGGGLWFYQTQFLPRAAQEKAKDVPASAAAAPPAIARFTASSESILAGSSVLLHWQVTGAEDVRIDPQVGRVAAADALEIKPENSTTYTLTARGPGGEKTATLSIAVNRPAPEPSKAEKAAKSYQAGLADRQAGHPDKALADFRQAAEMGDVRSMTAIGDALIDSSDDAEAAEAIRWYRKAGELGDAGAMLHLGAIYELGDKVQPDYELAAFWYRKGSEKGNAAAAYNLGRLYERGRGVNPDLAKAKELYQRAADRGNAEARIRLSQLSGK